MKERTLMERMEEYCQADAKKQFDELIEHTVKEAQRRLGFHYTDAEINRLLSSVKKAIGEHKDVFIPRFYERSQDCFLKDVQKLSEFFEKRLGQEAQHEKE